MPGGVFHALASPWKWRPEGADERVSGRTRPDQRPKHQMHHDTFADQGDWQAVIFLKSMVPDGDLQIREGWLDTHYTSLVLFMYGRTWRRGLNVNTSSIGGWVAHSFPAISFTRSIRKLEVWLRRQALKCDEHPGLWRQGGLWRRPVRLMDHRFVTGQGGGGGADATTRLTAARKAAFVR